MNTALRDYCLGLLEIHREILADPEVFDCQDHEERVARMDAAYRDMDLHEVILSIDCGRYLATLRRTDPSPVMVAYQQKQQAAQRKEACSRLRELLDKLSIDKELIP